MERNKMNQRSKKKDQFQKDTRQTNRSDAELLIMPSDHHMRAVQPIHAQTNSYIKGRNRNQKKMNVKDKNEDFKKKDKRTQVKPLSEREIERSNQISLHNITTNKGSQQIIKKEIAKQKSKPNSVMIENERSLEDNEKTANICFKKQDNLNSSVSLRSGYVKEKNILNSNIADYTGIDISQRRQKNKEDKEINSGIINIPKKKEKKTEKGRTHRFSVDEEASERTSLTSSTNTRTVIDESQIEIDCSADFSEFVDFSDFVEVKRRKSKETKRNQKKINRKKGRQTFNIDTNRNSRNQQISLKSKRIEKRNSKYNRM